MNSPAKPERPLSDSRITLLKDLLSESTPEEGGANAAKYRANHVSDWDDLDALQQLGYIERNAKTYNLRLVALAELRKHVGRVDSLLHLCSLMFLQLKQAYRDEPNKAVPLTALANKMDIRHIQRVYDVAW
jgi:hypothetical protein